MKKSDAFNLSCALEFFTARFILHYKSCESFRTAVDGAVEQVMKYKATISGEDATDDAREMLLAPYFTNIADKFAKEWLKDENDCVDEKNDGINSHSATLGKWVKSGEIMYCNKCKYIAFRYHHYCPHCGAQMEIEV